MKTVTVYEAEDGKQFRDQAQCLEYEQQFADLAAANDMLDNGATLMAALTRAHQTREHVQALGWGNREQLCTASQVHAVMSECAAMAAARERERGLKELRDAVRQLAALNAWYHFGDCRAWTAGPILSPLEADELARRVLRANVF